MAEHFDAPPAAKMNEDFGKLNESPMMNAGEEEEIRNEGLKKKLVKAVEGWGTSDSGDKVEVHDTENLLDETPSHSSRESGTLTFGQDYSAGQELSKFGGNGTFVFQKEISELDVGAGACCMTLPKKKAASYFHSCNAQGWNKFAAHDKLSARDLVRFYKAGEKGYMIEAVRREEPIQGQEHQKKKVKQESPSDESGSGSTDGKCSWGESVSVNKGENPQKAESLEGFLQSIGLERYLGAFEKEEFDMTSIVLATDQDMEKLNIPMGPRLKILSALVSKA